MMDRWGLEGMQSFEQERLSDLSSLPDPARDAQLAL